MAESCDITNSPGGNNIKSRPHILVIDNQIESLTPLNLSDVDKQINYEPLMGILKKNKTFDSSRLIEDSSDVDPDLIEDENAGRIKNKTDVHFLEESEQQPLHLNSLQDKLPGRSQKMIQLRTIYQWQGQQHQYLQPVSLNPNDDDVSSKNDQEIGIVEVGQNDKDMGFAKTDRVEVIVKKQARVSLEILGLKTHGKGMQPIWKHKALRIVHFISKFIQHLKTKTEKIKYRLLTNKVFDIIGDRTSDFEAILLSRKSNIKPQLKQRIERQIKVLWRIIQNIYQIAENFLGEHVEVLQPDSSYKMIWDSIVVLFIVLNLFYIPMKISFNINKNETYISQLLLETLPSYIFILEIFKNFNTAYYDKGIIHTDRRQISKNYIGSNFIWDLIVVIPFIISQFNVPYTDFTLLLRITRIRSMVQQLEDVLNMSDKQKAVFELLKLIYLLTFVIHFCACAWHYLAIVEVQFWGSDSTWLITQNLEDKPWSKQYIASIYWSTITILTVGYGDITPVTDSERIFVIFVSLVICGVFGYAISRIGEILKRIEEQNATYSQRMRIINQHIQKRGLKKALQLKVRKYFEYYFKLEQGENSQAEDLMSHLTKHLKEEVLIDIYHKTLKTSTLLGQNLSDSLLEKLCIHVKEKKFAPEEEVFSRGEQANKLIFVLSGEIQIYAEQGTDDTDQVSVATLLRTFKTGYCIGEREFATSRMYEYNAMATQFTQVALLDFVDLQHILKDHAQDYEKFCLIRDNLIFNQNYKNLGKVCEICQSTHGFLKCPFVFFQANQAKIANKFRQSKLQKRMWYQREKRKSNIKGCLIDIQEAALGFIVSNKIIPEIQLTDQYLSCMGFKLNDNQDQDQYFHQNPSALALHSNKGILQKLESQQQSNFDFHDSIMVMPTTQMRSDLKTITDTAFFAKENGLFESDLNDIELDWDKGISIKKKESSRFLGSPRKKRSSKDFSMIEEVVEDEQLALNIQQSINIKKVQFKIAKKNKIDLLGSIRSSKHFIQRDTEKQDSTQRQNNFKKQVSKQLNHQLSKLSVESGIYDKSDDFQQSFPQQSMQFLESKLLFEKDDISLLGFKQFKKVSVKKKLSLVNSNIEVNFRELMPSYGSTLARRKDTNEIQENRRKDMMLDSRINEDENDRDNLIDIQKIRSKETVFYTPEMDDNPDVSAEIREILHQHTDFQIDRQQSSKIYFPLFNLDNVMQKLNQNYEIKIEEYRLKESKRIKFRKTRTSQNPFDRIQQKFQIK